MNIRIRQQQDNGFEAAGVLSFWISEWSGSSTQDRGGHPIVS